MPSPSIRVSNFESGSSGFKIEGTGDAEFNDVTVRGALITGAGSSISGSYIDSISANKITTGSLEGETLTGGTIQTASSGSRIVLSESGSPLKVYNSGGTQTIAITTDGILYGNVSVMPSLVNFTVSNCHLGADVGWATKSWSTVRGQGTLSGSSSTTIFSTAGATIIGGIVGIVNAGGAGDSWIYVSNTVNSRDIYFDGGTTWGGTGLDHHPAFVVIPPFQANGSNTTSVTLHNTDTSSRIYYYSVVYVT